MTQCIAGVFTALSSMSVLLRGAEISAYQSVTGADQFRVARLALLCDVDASSLFLVVTSRELGLSTPDQVVKVVAVGPV